MFSFLWNTFWWFTDVSVTIEIHLLHKYPKWYIVVEDVLVLSGLNSDEFTIEIVMSRSGPLADSRCCRH